MNIEISTAQLNAGTKRFHDLVDRLDSTRAQVMSCLTELNGMWEGNAHDAFVAQCAVDEEMLEDLITNLNNLVKCLEYAESEYVSCDESVKEKIASIRLSHDS